MKRKWSNDEQRVQVSLCKSEYELINGTPKGITVLKLSKHVSITSSRSEDSYTRV